MKIQTYLKLRNKTVTKAAKELGVSRTWLSLIIHNKKITGRVLANRLIKWSDGAIRYEDLWG